MELSWAVLRQVWPLHLGGPRKDHHYDDHRMVRRQQQQLVQLDLRHCLLQAELQLQGLACSALQVGQQQMR